jgi:hypothetical protein
MKPATKKQLKLLVWSIFDRKRLRCYHWLLSSKEISYTEAFYLAQAATKRELRYYK